MNNQCYALFLRPSIFNICSQLTHDPLLSHCALNPHHTLAHFTQLQIFLTAPACTMLSTKLGESLLSPEHGGRPLAESSHIKHHHVHQKLTNSAQQNANKDVSKKSIPLPGARGTERSTSILSPLTTSWVTSETKSHSINQTG